MTSESSLSLDDRLLLYRNSIGAFLRDKPVIHLLTQMPGNIGDHLIWCGTRALLQAEGIDYKPVSVVELERGHWVGGTLVIPGSEAWSSGYAEWLPELTTRASGQFNFVLVLPSDFNPELQNVRRALSRENVFALARNVDSYDRCKHLGRIQLALDPALYCPRIFQEGLQIPEQGEQVLLSLRTDHVSALKGSGFQPNPELNNDLSATSLNLDQFLSTIARHSEIVTDRLHVAVAAYMQGKEVRFLDLDDHKLSNYFAYSFERDDPAFPSEISLDYLVEKNFAVPVGTI